MRLPAWGLSCSCVLACTGGEDAQTCSTSAPEIIGFSEAATGRIRDLLADMEQELRRPLPCISRIERSDRESDSGGGYFDGVITIFSGWSDESYGLTGIVRHEVCHAIDDLWGLRFGSRPEVPDRVELFPAYATTGARKRELMARLCGLEPRHLALLQELGPVCVGGELPSLVDTVFQEVYWPVSSGVEVRTPLETRSWRVPGEVSSGEFWTFQMSIDDRIMVQTYSGANITSVWAVDPDVGEWEEVDPAIARYPRVSSGGMWAYSFAEWRAALHELEGRTALQSLELPGLVPPVTTWSPASEVGELPAWVAHGCLEWDAQTLVGGRRAWAASLRNGTLEVVSLDDLLDETALFPWRLDEGL